METETRQERRARKLRKRQFAMPVKGLRYVQTIQRVIAAKAEEARREG